jgi:hypothetical protein
VTKQPTPLHDPVELDIGELLKYAATLIGDDYVFGAAGPNTFDCSGLVQYVFGHFGFALPRVSQDQARVGTSVDKGQIKPGDLVFSDWGDGPNSHVGIAVTPTKIIDAPHTGAKVRYDDLSKSYLDHVTAVRRVTPNTFGKIPDAPKGDGSLTSTFEGVLNGLTQTFTGQYAEIAKPLQDIGSAFIEIASIGDMFLKLFLPSTWIRLMSGFLGLILILFGIYFLAREARNT